MSCFPLKRILLPYREAAIGYHHVLSVGEAASIGVRTLIQQVFIILMNLFNVQYCMHCMQGCMHCMQGCMHCMQGLLDLCLC